MKQKKILSLSIWQKSFTAHYNADVQILIQQLC